MEASILCWWGAEIRTIDPSGGCSVRPIESARDPVAEILLAAAGLRGSGRVRIVYQPDTLEVHEVALAGFSQKPGRAGRSRLLATIARELPVLAEPGTAWCLSPGEAGAGGAVVHLERNSALPAIVEGLGRAGLKVEGAWPLPALAECAPTQGGRGTLCLAAAAGRALVVCVSPAGDRSIDLHNRGDVLEAAAASLRNALARFDEAEHPRGWLAFDGEPAALRSAASGLALTEVSIPDLLSKVRLLSPGGWADLVPGQRWWRRWRERRGLVATAAALALLVSVFSYRSAAERKDARLRRQRDEEAARLHVRAEAGERETRIERMHYLAAAASELNAARPAQGDFLLALASSVPKSAVLNEVSVDGGRITVTGRICDRSARSGDVAAKLCSDLAPPGVPWALRPDSTPPAGSDFILRGSFGPKSPVPDPPAAPGDTPDALARSEAGFAAACAQLPAAGAFEERLSSLCRGGWTAAGPTSDRRSGYELRHYSLRYANPRLGDWPEIVASIRGLCDEPALTIDRLVLTAAPDGAAAFSRAELGLTIRLKP
jgi:hypothetical protein